MFASYNRRLSSYSLMCLIAFLCLFQTAPLDAKEDFTARSVTAPAPQEVPSDPLAFAAPMSNAEADDREGQLGTHHRPTPIAALPPDALALPPPAPPNQSNPSPLAIAQPLDRNHVLTDTETANATSTVNEPSVAARGNEVLVTGNWFAAFSTNSGASFNYLNPTNTFPASPQGIFCCDQVALYDAGDDVMFWFLQYRRNNVQNTIRLAVAQGADIAAQQWRIYDFTPLGIGNWNNEWFDYPDLAVGDDNLYLTTNTFSTVGTGGFTRAVILRIPLAELAGYQALNIDVWDTTTNGSLRLTQGAGDIMYFASHVSAATLRVFSWPEAGNTITSNDVAVTTWPGTGNRPGWTGRSDSRITAAWRSGDEIGFGWTASEGLGFPHPHARFAIIDRNTMNIVDEPHLWNQNFPYAYPAAAPNANGVVAIGAHFGDDPSHTLGVLNSTTTPRTWDLVTTRTGTDSPSNNLWGDYTSVRVHGNDPQSWVATGFTLQGGTARQDIETQYLHFREGQIIVQPQTAVALAVEDPNDRLGDGDSMWVRGTVTVNGTLAPNVDVTFTTTSANLTVAPATVPTDAQGVAQATLTSHAGLFDSDTVQVTATANGVTSSPVPVKVPDVTIAGFVILLTIMLAASLYWRRRYVR